MIVRPVVYSYATAWTSMTYVMECQAFSEWRGGLHRRFRTYLASVPPPEYNPSFLAPISDQGRPWVGLRHPTQWWVRLYCPVCEVDELRSLSNVRHLH